MKNIRQMIDEECENLKLLLKSKNTSYGDSFFKTLEKYGSSAVCIRMEDKINRISTLSKKSEKLFSEGSRNEKKNPPLEGEGSN